MNYKQKILDLYQVESLDELSDEELWECFHLVEPDDTALEDALYEDAVKAYGINYGREMLPNN
jgi:hypothetical protein